MTNEFPEGRGAGGRRGEVMLVVSLLGSKSRVLVLLCVLNITQPNILMLTRYRLGAPVSGSKIPRQNEAFIAKRVFRIPYPAVFGTF